MVILLPGCGTFTYFILAERVWEVRYLAVAGLARVL